MALRSTTWLLAAGNAGKNEVKRHFEMQYSLSDRSCAYMPISDCEANEMQTDDTANYDRDEVYLESAPKQPKHMFVHLADLIDKRHDCSKEISVLDVGCASGDYLSYFKDRFPATICVGVEISPALVEVAQRRMPNMSIVVGDANKLDGIDDNRFDVVTMTGTHSIFDDFRPSFDACLRVAKPKGQVLITGLFNDYPVDARIHWRYSGEFEASWHPGYNLFSKKSIEVVFNEDDRIESFSYLPFSLPFDLEPQADPIRSWTAPDSSDPRQLVNGIMPLNIQILSINLR